MLFPTLSAILSGLLFKLRKATISHIATKKILRKDNMQTKDSNDRSKGKESLGKRTSAILGEDWSEIPTVRWRMLCDAKCPPAVIDIVNIS